MLSDWWNGAELWVAGLAFPLQFAIVMAVLMPVVLVVAWLIDRFVDHAAALFGPSPVDDRPIRTAQPPAEPDPAEDTGDTGADDAEQVPAGAVHR